MKLSQNNINTTKLHFFWNMEKEVNGYIDKSVDIPIYWPVRNQLWSQTYSQVHVLIYREVDRHHHEINQR